LKAARQVMVASIIPHGMVEGLLRDTPALGS
jgi:hypothetical protein